MPSVLATGTRTPHAARLPDPRAQRHPPCPLCGRRSYLRPRMAVLPSGLGLAGRWPPWAASSSRLDSRVGRTPPAGPWAHVADRPGWLEIPINSLVGLLRRGRRLPPLGKSPLVTGARRMATCLSDSLAPRPFWPWLARLSLRPAFCASILKGAAVPSPRDHGQCHTTRTARFIPRTSLFPMAPPPFGRDGHTALGRGAKRWQSYGRPIPRDHPRPPPCAPDLARRAARCCAHTTVRTYLFMFAAFRRGFSKNRTAGTHIFRCHVGSAHSSAPPKAV